PSPLTTPLSTSAPDLPKSAPPVPILPSQLARIYSVLHPAALLSVFAARFPALVADPVSEMAQQLPILALAHVTYAMICLPPAGSDVSPSAPTSPASTASGSATGTATPSGNVILRPGKPALLSLTLTTLLATPTLSILLILFGAPFTTHHVQTLLCAAHMAILSSTALIYVHGVDGPVWKEIWGCKRPGDAVWGGALGTAVGAWLGAVPIPLDW
ncbi:hypothetical protein BO78DRAFT_286161, partial [Aspergillus sclerotiicarbonarius CBS 121057]